MRGAVRRSLRYHPFHPYHERAPYPIARIDLGAEVDPIDDCHWAIYECTTVLLDGTIIKGCSIQSDGFEMAFETLENEDGYPLDLSRYGGAPSS